MIKTNRCIALILVLALLCGIVTTACADVVTVGIYFCGRRIAEDGSEVYVRLEGKFRVMQNGEEAGTINAGKETLTLNGTGKIRIEPMAETIAPEWDLSTATAEFTPEAGGTMTVPIVAELLKEGASAARNTVPVPDEPDDEDNDGDLPELEEAGTWEDEDDEAYEPVMSASGPVSTPTLPPYDLSSIMPTQEPLWTVLSGGSGKVRVFAFYDKNSNGLAEDGENGVANVKICLLTENEEAVAAVGTGSDGIALFENLPAGNYRIKAILPQGWEFEKKGSGEAYASMFGSSAEGEEVSDLFAVGDETTATPGVSLSKCLHVSGACWYDSTADGLYAEGEPALPGILIELDGVKNGLHYETLSREDGTWFIDRVAPALYNMTVHAPEGMMFTRASNKNGRKNVIYKDGTGTASRRVDLNDKDSKERQYVGFVWAGQITGRCFLDANYNGMYDEGEEPMPGVKVTAIKQASDEEIAVTYSGEDGTYKLTGLRANTYKMRAVLPQDGSDFTRTVSDPLGNHFAARPGRRENFWKNFVLAGAEQREMNVGVIYPGTIVGTVYLDNDFSGTHNGKEKTISGYLVKLLDEKGNTVTTDKTSVKGKYELVDVPPGDYTLSVTALKDYAFTRLGEGNVILNRTNGEGYSETIHMGLGDKKTGMDIGMILPGVVTGSVFADRNDNGIRDGGENGLAGVTVRLMGEEGEAFRAEIGEDGTYLFDAVMPGSYHLEYMLPENAVFARTTSGGNTISGEGTGISNTFKMSSGDRIEGPVCGALTLGRIEGTAYLDHNGDGKMNEGEETADGLTLTLTPSRSELEEITVTADENGRFVLGALRPDTYTLTVTCEDMYVVSRTDELALPLTAGKKTQSVSLPVEMGAVWTGQNVGTVMPAAVSGQLWLDENNNGLFDAGEQTPAGYSITVTDDWNGKVFDTLRTDEEGRFSTSGMIPGTFTLSFPLDAQTIAPKDGNSNFREENGKLVISGLHLSENENREGLLLGIVRYTSIGGSVWIDRGSNVETLAGAVITLKDGDGNTLSSQTTADNGAYRFDKLMPGVYQLEADMPEGCVIIEPGDHRLNGDQISVLTETLNRTGSSDLIDLKMAEDQLQMNIGCVLPGRIGDVCWLDLDGDGLQGMNEPGIPGVQITLVRDGETVAETVSDQYGFYRFSDLYPATYILQVQAPAEVKPTKRRTDIPMIASVLEEEDSSVYESIELQVESDRANYNADLGFVCRRDGVIPAGVGEGEKQIWKQAK